MCLRVRGEATAITIISSSRVVKASSASPRAVAALQRNKRLVLLGRVGALRRPDTAARRPYLSCLEKMLEQLMEPETEQRLEQVSLLSSRPATLSDAASQGSPCQAALKQ